MSRRAGSEAAAPRSGSTSVVLALLAVGFLLLFWWQRSRSTFLQIEAERPRAVEVADRHGLQLAEAFALRDLIGLDASQERWQAAAADFATWRALYGPAFAAVMVGAPSAEARAAVEADLRAADSPADGATDGAIELAWQRFRLRAEALPGLRFLAMRDRFAARSAARR